LFRVNLDVMIKNMGTIDRSLRTLITIVFAVLILTGVAKGVGLALLAVFGVFFLLTVIFGFCPFYNIVGMHTLRTKSGNDV
jgi:uncharacterized membrane protein YhiD involved in acid resistance